MPFNSPIPRLSENNKEQSFVDVLLARFVRFADAVKAVLQKIFGSIAVYHRVVQGVMVLLILAMIGLGLRVAYVHYWMYQHSDDVQLLSSYDIDASLSRLETLDLTWLLQTVVDTTSEITNYTTYLASIQAPYYDLLQNIYLPSLNLWKNPYTEELSLAVVGQDFIDKNPLNNTNIIAFWSNYLKTSLYDTDTRITDVVVDEPTMDGWFYAVPITITFEAPSKRAFLMIVDKLSITSNLDSLALIQKFVYTLWEDIRSRYENIPGGVYNDVDKDIGALLTDWLDNKKTQSIIDSASVLRVIAQLAHCSSSMSQEACLYAFRDMYRSVPSLAYSVGSPYAVDRVEAIRTFLAAVPPLLRIEDFSFVPMQSVSVKDTRYQGRVRFLMYGTNVVPKDVADMADHLGMQCTGKDPLYPTIALELVDNALRDVGQLSIATQQQSADLVLLKNIITEDIAQFDNKSEYEQMIALIELYTMLDDAGVCTIR
jgi:hypothetical protein